MDIRTERLKKAFEQSGYTQSELCDKADINKGAFSSYLAGRYYPKQSSLEKLSAVLNVSISWLMGYDVPMNRTDASTPASNKNLNFVRIPVLGYIPAGIPIEAVEDIVDWEDLSLEQFNSENQYIGLRVKGDSMEPRYLEGDTLIVRVQSDCESGQDAIVYVNGYDATLKRVVKQQFGIMLQPLNPKYEPAFYEYGDETSPIVIAGVVVEIRRKVL